ncbi:ribosome recycling factor [Neisseria sicca]|uniref:ribosome recycling factor n=1 Tax=Neisseria sicca TaxID=490 RepID=UPI0034D9764A
MKRGAVGDLLGVGMGMLTEEGGKDLIKVVGREGEEGGVWIRKVGGDGKDEMKKVLKEKEIWEEEGGGGEEGVEKVTEK